MKIGLIVAELGENHFDFGLVTAVKRIYIGFEQLK